MSDAERKYTDEQMALILHRAGDLQAQREDGRHSLAEIQEIARQVGVDPALVAHVAAGLSDRAPVSPAASSAAVQTTEAVLPKRVTTEEMGRIVDAVRRASGAQGTSRQVFDSVEWRWGSEHELVDVRVTITPSAEHTNLRVQHDASGAAFLSWMLGGMGTLIGGMTALSTLPGAGGAAVTAGIAGLAGAGLLAVRRILKRRGEAVVERITRAVQEEADSGPDGPPNVSRTAGP